MKKLLLAIFMGSLFATANAQKIFGEITMQDGSVITLHDGENNQKAKSGKKKHTPKLQLANKNVGVSQRIWGRITYGAQILYYFDEDGEINDIAIKDINKVVLEVEALKKFEFIGQSAGGGAVTYYFNLSNSGTKAIVLKMLVPKKKTYRLMEVVAESDNYTLASRVYRDVNFFTVFDKQGNVVEKEWAHSLTQEKSINSIETVKQYFGDCSTLISGMESNVKNSFKHGNKMFNKKYHYNLFSVDEDRNITNYLTNLQCN